MIDILFPAFLLSLVLLGIHSFFGLKIIERGIIFTDLAIGQAAAFGAAAAIVFFDGKFTYPLSLSFALGAGLMIAYFSARAVHLEAVIGLLYALGYSAVFMMLSNAPHGMESFNSLMAYDIIFTDKSEVLITAILYSAIGLVLFFSVKKLSGRAAEIVFFAAFAVTVTSSVRLAGVFVVFAILLGPAFISLRLAEFNGTPEIFKRYPVFAAWIAGTLINLSAIGGAFCLDLPTGYTVVFANCFAAVLAAALASS